MIEKAGIPAAHLTAMTSMAKIAGANRILSSGLIPHPVGDPTRSHDEEVAWRKGQVQKALNAVATPLDEAMIFPDW
jgi:glycine reductase